MPASLKHNDDLTDTQWSKMHIFLQHDPNARLGKGVRLAETRAFIDGIRWIDRTRKPWREMPDNYGNWNSVYRRFKRWCQRGVWGRMRAYFAHDLEMQQALISETLCQEHGELKVTDQDNRPMPIPRPTPGRRAQNWPHILLNWNFHARRLGRGLASNSAR